MPATTHLRSIYILSFLLLLGLCVAVKNMDFTVSRGPDDWVVESITSEFHLQDESCAVFVNQTYDVNFPRPWATKISIPLPRLEHTSDMSSKNIQNFKVVSSFNLQKHYVEEPADQDSKDKYFAILQIEFEPVGGRQRLFVEYIIKESVRREKYSSLRVSEQIFGDDAVTKNVFEWSFMVIGAEVEYIKAKFLLPAQWKLAEDHIEVEPKSLISYKSSSLVELVQKSTLSPDTSLYMRIAFDSKVGNCKEIVEKSWLDTLYKVLMIIGGVVCLFCCCACLSGICITVRRLTHHNTEKVHLIIPPPPIQRSEAAGQYSSIYTDPHQPSAPPSYHYPSATI